MLDVTQIYLATVGQVEPNAQPGILELITDADLVVQLVLLALVGMSVGCWVIILNKFTALRKAEQQSQVFLRPSGRRAGWTRSMSRSTATPALPSPRSFGPATSS